METIILEGGPAHGKTMAWSGGDELHIEVTRPVIDFSVPTCDPIRFDPAIYRRSLRSRSIFVYQP